MKQKKVNGQTVTYGYANPELHKQLRQCKSAVMIDRKKQSKKNACRSHRDRTGDFFIWAEEKPTYPRRQRAGLITGAILYEVSLQECKKQGGHISGSAAMAMPYCLRASFLIP